MTSDPPQIAILGGGLAGMAAAVVLADRGLRIELLEAKRRLGGRAGSYVDRQTGESIDHCQHVAMGCCTNYLDFCRRTGIDDLFARHQTLHFFGPDGQRSDFQPRPWLPAPLHLAPALLRLKHLSLSDKLALARAMHQLGKKGSGLIVLDWLRQQRQSDHAIERFWKPVLESALAESLDRASLAAARKVFLDGFLGHPDACHVLVPCVSLGTLYDRVAARLVEQGVQIRLETPVKRIEQAATGSKLIIHAATRTGPAASAEFDFVILAVPWNQAPELIEPDLLAYLPQFAAARLHSAPITSVHLWFDRPITDLAHAVLVGRLSQWVFRRTDFQSVRNEIAQAGRIGIPSYYQVVISASHALAGRPREAIRDEVLADLATAFPATQSATLLHWQIIHDQDAVFSCRPGSDDLRPPQATPIPNLILAGDWTRTGWPATMEGAVRSGYLAAEALLVHLGRPEKLLVPDLPKGWLVKLLFG